MSDKNVLEISVLSPAVVAAGGSPPEPVVRERTWGDFLPVEEYFQNVTFLKSSNVGSPPLKRAGDNLPGKNGIDYTYSPVAETQKEFEFLVRSNESEADAREIVKNFVKWLYSLGEFHISFNGESQYRRMIYTFGNDYQMLDGVYGFDANFTLTLTCMDSLSYAKNYVDLPFEWSSQSRYGIATNHNTVDYTPVIMEHEIYSAGETVYTYRALSEICYDGINKPCAYFSLFPPQGSPFVTPFTIVLNGETSELYILKDGVKYNYLNAISTDISLLTQNRTGNYIPTSFPYLMATNTFYAYTLQTVGGGSASDPRFYYRPRVLAYD